ncbi:MAG TPA: ABC transporter ATP-binding protein, partial [Bifidobacterium sp.]|nr:ABC transporter ATP-binding protein [Bifidobacterium sp.]
RLIIADEPTTALDSITQRQIVDLLTSLVDDAGASMLFITHDFSVLKRATTRCYVLSEGRVVESGATDALLARPATPEAAHLVRAARELSLDIEGGR